MRAKEYAVSLGLATPGRGRMSREAHEAVKKAISEGQTFDDYFVKGSSPKPADKPVKVSAKAESKDQAEGDNVYAQAFMRYPLDQMFKGTDSHGKTHKVSARVACMRCGYSLAGHSCDSPLVLVGSAEPIMVIPIGE